MDSESELDTPPKPSAANALRGISGFPVGSREDLEAHHEWFQRRAARGEAIPVQTDMSIEQEIREANAWCRQKVAEEKQRAQKAGQP